MVLMKPSGFWFFHNSYMLLHFDEFCRMRCFDSSCFWKILFQIFENFKFDRPVFGKPVTSFSSFHENWPDFKQFFNPWSN
jgi:hypothetical protein